MNGTNGRVYGGDLSLVHIPDHHRTDVGEGLAKVVDEHMRTIARVVGTNAQGLLCPGCYMIALFDAAIALARQNGQPVQELGHSMADLFTKLAYDGDYRPTEEMVIRP